MYVISNAMQLSAYLRALRRSRRLTQAELGVRLGVSAARIGRIERNPGAVGVDNILSVLRLLGARLELVDQEADESATGLARASAAGAPRTHLAGGEGIPTHHPAGEW